jgi:adenosylcobinamide kinase/adenosylcobinamide-phosphate guanylyltransferase
MAARIAFVGGGARSGKSRFALQLARARGERRVFVATAQALDAEMAARIAAHQGDRGVDFRTIEEPLGLPALVERLALARESDVVVIDCLTLWLSNLLLRGDAPERISTQLDALAAALDRRAFHAIVVSNEVGLGVVPETALGRAFRDLAGFAHQRLAAIADDVYWALLGCVLRVRPEPVALEPH